MAMPLLAFFGGNVPACGQIVEPAPITTLCPNVGWRFPLFQEVPPNVTP